MKEKFQVNSIFVYGTLMRGFNYHRQYLADHVIGFTEGCIKGRLYHLNYGYPAATGGDGTVKGEIFEVMDMENLISDLDFLEDYNQPGEEDMYTRTIIEAADIEGNIKYCYVYLWSIKRIDELEREGTYIKHGDWRKFLNDSLFSPEGSI